MVLVTGGTGFLGSTLIQHLVQKGHRVIATKRVDSIIPSALVAEPAIHWVDADITDYFALADIFGEVTQVYHCAAVVSYQKSDWTKMMHTNIQGTKHIVDLCLEHQARLVHVSSIASLGPRKNNELISENNFWDDGAPHSKYSLSKYESEMEVWRGVAEGLDAVIVNPSVIMGTGNKGKGAGALFKLINKGLKIYPTGSVGIVDVADVASVMMQLMDNTDIHSERFILNSDNLSNKHLLEKIAHLLEKPAPSIPARKWLLSIAWRAAKVQSFFSKKKPALTKETAKASSTLLAYSNKKIIATTNFQFKPVVETLKEMSLDYK